MKLFLPFILFSVWSLNSTGQSSTRSDRKKDLVFFFEYNQIERGFISIESDLRYWKGKPDGYPIFQILGLSGGYNPWQKDLIFEFKSYYNIFFLSAGTAITLIDPIDTGSPSSVGIKPQIGFDLYAFKLYYGYQFMLTNRPEYMNYHNISLSVFLFGKNEFYNWKEKTKWYTWPSNNIESE